LGKLILFSDICKKRGQIEIIIDILSVIASGAKKPNLIMYRANLSWVSLSQHLEKLLLCGWIEVTQVGNGRRIYSITDDGIAALSDLKRTLGKVLAWGEKD